MPIEGTLKELNLANIIQLNCTEMNTATVSLSYQGKGGIICFSQGNIVHAAVGDLVGEEAVYELLTWPDASFVVETEKIPPGRTISSNWSELLLEGIRRVDEGGQLLDDSAEEEPGLDLPGGTDDLPALAKELKKLAGVEGSVIISRDGVVLASEIEGNPEKEGAVAALVGGAAEHIGEAMNLVPFERGLVNMGAYRMVILKKPHFFIGLSLAEQASPALLSAEAAKLLG